HLLGLLRVEQLPAPQCLFDGFLQPLQRVLVELAELHVLILVAALEEKVRQRLHQIFSGDPEVLAGISRVVDPLHWYCRRDFRASSCVCVSRFLSPAVNSRSSLREMRRCAYRPSSTNSAAEARSASVSLDPRPSCPVFSSKPWIPLSCLMISADGRF